MKHLYYDGLREMLHCPLCRHDIRTQINNLPLSPIRSNSPTSNPLPFIQQLASIISNQLTQDVDFSGNINIELQVPGNNR